MTEEEKQVHPGTEDNDSDLEEGEYEVERILDVGVVDADVRFLVRWKGYDSGEDTWEPEDNLDTAKLILEEYMASHQEEVQKAQEEAKKAKDVLTRKKSKRIKLKTGKTERKGGSRRSLRRARKESSSDGRGTVGTSADGDNNGSDDDFASKAQKRRRTERNLSRAAKKVNESSSVFKEPTPANPRNAWLYDDVDDAESDGTDTNLNRTATEGGTDGSPEKPVKVHIKLTNDEGEPLVKGSSLQRTLEENVSEVERKSSKKASREKRSRKKDPIESHLMVNDKPASDISPNGKRQSAEHYETNPEIEILGLVRCPDSAIKVVYKRKGDAHRLVVSVKEAFEVDGYGLVQYLLSRCEFGPLGEQK